MIHTLISICYTPRGKKLSRVPLILLTGLLLLLPLIAAPPAHADPPPPGIQEYYVLGYEPHIYRMYVHGGGSDYLASTSAQEYMASIVDVTVTADDQIIFYDHWEDGYEVNIFEPSKTDPITGTLVLGDGDPSNGSAAALFPDLFTQDVLRAGDSLPFSSRYDYTVATTSPITGYIPVSATLRSNAFRFDGGDRIVSAGGPIGLVHVVWPAKWDSESSLLFEDKTYLGDSWEIYSTQALRDGLQYTAPIGKDMSPAAFKHVDLQVQALEDNTTVTIDNGAGISVTFQLQQGETYASGGGSNNNGYINDDEYPSLAVDINAGTTIVADKPIQAGLITYEIDGSYCQDRFYNMIPQDLWDKYYLMPTSDHPVGTKYGHSEVYIYNHNTLPITVTSADKEGENGSMAISAQSVISHQVGIGAADIKSSIPELSGIRLSSDRHFWGLHVADAAGGTDGQYDWGNTFLPLFFLTDEYYASWAPGHVETPPPDNGSPLWVTAVEDNTRVNVDYDNDGLTDESFLLDSLAVVMLYDDSDNDQSGTHVWAEDGQKIAVIWGEDAVTADGAGNYLDIGHLMLPISQEWIDPVYFFEKSASPEVLPETGGEVLFSLRATASSFADVSDLVLTDTLPVSWTYESGSTIIQYPDGSIGSFDPATSTVTSTLSGGQVATHTVLYWDLSTDLAPEQSIELQFQAAISNPNGHIGPRFFDGFESDDYQGGTGPWTSDWTDSQGDGSAAGDIQIVDATDDTNVAPYRGDYHLRIADDDQTMTRTLDLSHFTRPVLRFKRYFRSIESADVFGVQLSTDGASYTPVLTWTNPSENIWVQEEVDLSSYITDTVYLRFRGVSSVEADDYLYLDDIEIYDSFGLHINQATARGQYFGYDFVSQARKNVHLSPFMLSKAVSAEQIGLGETVVFTLTYSNNSDVITGTDFVIQDTLPPGLLFAGASDGGVYITATNTVSWTVGDILTTTHDTLVLTTTVVDNVRPEDGDPMGNTANLLNDDYFVRSNLILVKALAPDLHVTKRAPGSVHPGDRITYTIQYENQGTIPATNSYITDVLPANTTYVTDSCTGTVSCSFDSSADTVTWNLGSVDPGESGSLSFAVETADTIPLGTNVQNVASIHHDYLSTPDTAIANTKVSQIELDKTASAALIGPAQEITFTLSYAAITNTTAFIYDAIPAHTSYVAGSAFSETGTITPAYSTDGITYQATEPDPASSVSHLRWEVQVISDTTQSTQFRVQVDDALDNDVTLENQASLSGPTVDEIYSNLVSIPTVKLSLDKTGPNIVEPGETFTYTLHLSNLGSGAAALLLTDTLPLSTTFVTASPTPDSGTGNPVTWSLTLPANTYNVEYTIAVSTTDTIPLGTELENQARLSSDQHADSDALLTYVAQDHVTIVPNNTDAGHQTEQVCYAHTVFNNSAISDTINLTATHDLWTGLAVSWYKDVNGNGTYQSSTDTPLTDTNSDSITDTGLIEADHATSWPA